MRVGKRRAGDRRFFAPGERWDGILQERRDGIRKMSRLNYKKL